MRELRDTSGRLLETQERRISYAEGAVMTINHENGSKEFATFRVTDDSVPVELLATYLRGLPGAPDREMRFRLITRDGRVVPMLARIVSEEPVPTPAGTFDCYKTELRVTGLLGLVARLVLPKMYIWHSVRAPHIWVKYQGVDGRVGSPEVVMELVRFEAPGGGP